MKPYYDDDLVTLWHGDALDVLPTIPAESVDAVITDPPYFGVLGESWDNQWRDVGEFMEWLRRVADEWHRVLKPNGTLYVFASSQMVARVEVEVLDRCGFLTLNRPVWHKGNGSTRKANRDGLTQFHSGDNERVLMACPVKRDGDAIDARNAYANALHKLRADVFAPLREYLAAERDCVGLSDREIDDALGCNGMAGHWFGASQWSLPSRDRYQQLRDLFNQRPGDYLRREYDYLRREYDDLRREYDDLRRPFDLGPELPTRPRGEVWRFAPVGRHEKGHHAHPAEKPIPLMEHIVATSTREGMTVLDTFAGSGSTGVACANLDRRFIGIERDPQWITQATSRIRTAATCRQGVLL